MPLRETYKGWDKFALYVAGVRGISDSFGDQEPQIAQAIRQTITQYWTSQSNIAVIFATIFSSIFLGLFFNMSGNYKLVVIPILIAFVYFSLKAWAYGRCAQIVCRLWL